jgi:cyanophycinase
MRDCADRKRGNNVRRFRLALAICLVIFVVPANRRLGAEEKATPPQRLRPSGIDGGRQWRFIDAYEGTKAEPLLRDVLRRGGVIGGSSAGASIQAEYLVRGSPLNNTDIICEGYERGLGFRPGVAIDQHFAARHRFADMTALMKTCPQLLGIGIDESTALVVQGHIGEIMGHGKVYFYDRRKPLALEGPDYEEIGAGGRYDLKERVLSTGK